jgi:hypothetical protein
MPIVAATIFLAALHLFGEPSHVTRRPSATKFWSLDLSCGVGAISSPVLSEHPKNVSEFAMLTERFFAAAAADAPPWLLLSAVGVVTRELATRQLRDSTIPSLVASDDAKPKAQQLAKRVRDNFDTRVQRTLQPAGYGNAERILNRFVDAELNELKDTIGSLDDVVSHEITQSIMEVVEAESMERIQTTVNSVVQLNASSAERDLAEIFRQADVDGNEVITFDELFELLAGQKIDPTIEPLAREIPVLKTARTARNKWESWGSLLVAPQVRKLQQVGQVGRSLFDAIGEAANELGRGTSSPAAVFTNGLSEFTRSWEALVDQEASAKQQALEQAAEDAARAAAADVAATRALRGRWRKPWLWRDLSKTMVRRRLSPSAGALPPSSSRADAEAHEQ